MGRRIQHPWPRHWVANDMWACVGGVAGWVKPYCIFQWRVAAACLGLRGSGGGGRGVGGVMSQTALPSRALLVD
jgi:hypothetical protein